MCGMSSKLRGHEQDNSEVSSLSSIVQISVCDSVSF